MQLELELELDAKNGDGYGNGHGRQEKKVHRPRFFGDRPQKDTLVSKLEYSFQRIKKGHWGARLAGISIAFRSVVELDAVDIYLHMVQYSTVLARLWLTITILCIPAL
jgi:hypothetical protein